MNIAKLIESREKSISQIDAQLADYDERIKQVSDPGQRTQLRNIASTWRSRVTKLRAEVVALRALARVPSSSCSGQVDLDELAGSPGDHPAPGPVMGKGKAPKGA